jgi:hypothetical protein
MTRDWTQVNLRLSKELHDKVVAAALENKQTVNGWLREAIAGKLGIELSSIAAEIVIPHAEPTDAQLAASRRLLTIL